MTAIDKIQNSETYKNREFDMPMLVSELGGARSSWQWALQRLVQQGELVMRLERSEETGGRKGVYRNPFLTSRKFLSQPLRKHTNEELGFSTEWVEAFAR